MTDSDELEDKRQRNRQDRYAQIKRWAEYVRSHPDDDWGAQVNTLVDAQLASARHFDGERPSVDELRDSPLFQAE